MRHEDTFISDIDRVDPDWFALRTWEDDGGGNARCELTSPVVTDN
jgi:hypothetical protein